MSGHSTQSSNHLHKWQRFGQSWCSPPESTGYCRDSKVSLTAYERFFNAKETDIKAGFKEHVQSIQQHVKGLSAIISGARGGQNT